MALVPTIRGLKSPEQIQAKEEYLEDELDPDHLNYDLTKLRCIADTTPERFPQQCADRMRRYLRFSPLIRDTDVKVIALWAMPRFADSVRLTETEQEFVESVTASILDKTIAVHNWHIPPTPEQGRCKGADFNPIFSSVLDLGGIPILITERGHNLRGQFIAMMNYIVSDLNLERSRKNQPLIPTPADAKRKHHQDSGKLFLCEQLACLPQSPTTVPEVIAGLDLLGYDVLPNKVKNAEVFRIRPRIHPFLKLAIAKGNPTFSVSLSGLVQEIALVREIRQDAKKKTTARTAEPVKHVQPVAADPASIPVGFNWASEENFLLSLARKADLLVPQLRKAYDVEDLYAVLGLKLKKKFNAVTSTLGEGENSITLPDYRPLFVIRSACIRHELATLGLVLPPPTTAVTTISDETHRIARFFTGLAGFGKELWPETSNKLKQPKVLDALKREWPNLTNELDEQMKIARLHRALTKVGLNQFEANRIVFAVCDPLAQRMGTVGPKARGLEQECAPNKARAYYPPRTPSKPSANVRPKDPVKPATPAPAIPVPVFDWTGEEAFLLSLEKNARRLGQQLRSVRDLKAQFALLDLHWDEDTVTGSATLRQGTDTITLAHYRPVFVVQSTCIRHQLNELGLVVSPPATTDAFISVEAHAAAKKLINHVSLRITLWGDTADLLTEPRVLKALTRVWPSIQAETDEETKAKLLFEALKETGWVTSNHMARITTAVCDPLAQSLGTIQTKALGLEKVCMPSTKQTYGV